MSMGSGDKGDWRCFQDAAARNPQILFVVSAGNDGKDIDRQPVYPAALTLSNMLVVTSSDSFGRLGRGSNVGASSVDVMVPGERADVIDHRGARAETAAQRGAARCGAGVTVSDGDSTLGPKTSSILFGPGD